MLGRIEVLRQIFLGEVSPQVESALGEIRNLRLEGSVMLTRLEALRERYRLNPPDDADRSQPAEATGHSHRLFGWDCVRGWEQCDSQCHPHFKDGSVYRQHSPTRLRPSSRNCPGPRFAIYLACRKFWA